MAVIAAEAGVAVQSLYPRFGSKLAILSDALDVAIVGDDSPVPLLERPWVQQMLQAGSGPAALRVFVTQTRQICERSYFTVVCHRVLTWLLRPQVAGSTIRYPRRTTGANA
jgi:AcrR family transcriptional regulator